MKINKRTLKRLIREELEAQSNELDGWWDSLDPMAKQELIDIQKEKLASILAQEIAVKMKGEGHDSYNDDAITIEGEADELAYSIAQQLAKLPKYAILDGLDVGVAASKAAQSFSRRPR